MRECRMIKFRDLYAVLDVDSVATAQEIKEAYRYKVQILHPDRLMNVPESVRLKAQRELIRVNRAYAALSDAGQRAKFDSERMGRHQHYETTGSQDTRGESSRRSSGGPTTRPRGPSSSGQERREAQNSSSCPAWHAHNWFERHLHWTYFFGTAVSLLCLTAEIANERATEAIECGPAAAVLLYLMVAGWVLRQKGRSLGWLLALPFPLLGPFIIYFLNNEKTTRLHSSRQ